MSRAEDLLKSLSIASASPSTEKHIVIDDDRIINIPDELKRVGVQYDHNVETVTFDCPRYWDDVDMSTMKIYINYLRSDNQAGSFVAENIEIDDSDNSIIHFTWTITRNVTEVHGRIAFLVCVRKTDDDGNEVNHWNTELNRSAYVSEGLNCHDDIVTKYPDVITYILTKIDKDATIVPGANELVSIRSVEQTTTSTEDGGINVITITLTNGDSTDIYIRNGSGGSINENISNEHLILSDTSTGIEYMLRITDGILNIMPIDT